MAAIKYVNHKMPGDVRVAKFNRGMQVAKGEVKVSRDLVFWEVRRNA